MALPGSARSIALIGLALVLLVFTGHAAATTPKTTPFQASECFQKCIPTPEDCTAKDAKCWCKAVDISLFEDTIDCMKTTCRNRLSDSQKSLFDPILEKCGDLDIDIPDKTISDARQYLVQLLSGTSTAKPTTAAESSTTTTTTIKPTPSSSSSSTSTSATPLVIQTTEPASPNPTTPAQSSSGGGGSGNRAPVDDSPFGDPDGSGAPRGLAAFASWAALLPLVAAVLVSFR